MRADVNKALPTGVKALILAKGATLASVMRRDRTREEND
jgi:hypothetical protein